MIAYDLFQLNKYHCFSNNKFQVSDFKFQIPDSRFQVPSSKFQFPSSRFQVSDFKFQIPISNFQFPDFKFQIPDSRFQVPSSNFQVPDSKFQISSSRFQIPDSNFQFPDSKFHVSDFTFQILIALPMTNTSACCLPVQFRPADLLDDLAKALRLNWNTHYNTKDYAGTWTSISLISASGNETDTFALPATQFIETPLLLQCTYFKSILDQFLFEKESVRLMRLAPGSIIKPHRDLGLAYRFGNFRLHIPITTDEQVQFIVAGKTLPMQIGECWYADFDAVHEVNHHGKNERIHLVIDGIRNAWTDTLFAQAGYDFEAEKKHLNNAPDEKTIRLMIEELERQNNPNTAQLIQQLRSGLHGK